jgi:hypothetical protein
MNKYLNKAREALTVIDNAFKPPQPTPLPDENLWRPLTSRSEKDLKPIDHDKMLSLAYFVWMLNPTARSIVELKKDYVVGDGMTYTAEDEDVQAWLDKFWHDPINQWRNKIHSKVRELILYGEQCWPVFVDEFTGMVRLGYLDPKNIKEVIVDPMNCETAIGVMWKVGLDKYYARTILDESTVSEKAREMRAGYEHGDVFYFAINKLSNATRGLSDLLPVLDALDVLDRLLFNRAEKVEVLSNYWVDVTIPGATQEEINQFMETSGAQMPKPGRFNAHNDRIQYEIMAPRLEAYQFKTDFDLIRNYIGLGMGFPEHWLGEGGNVNRATALEMGGPPEKRLHSFQDNIEGIMRYIFQFVIQQGKAKGDIPQNADETFTVTFPELSVQDLEKHAKTLDLVTRSLVQLKMDGQISNEQAQDLLKIVFQPFGVELDFEDMELETQESWGKYTDLLKSTVRTA